MSYESRLLELLLLTGKQQPHHHGRYRSQEKEDWQEGCQEEGIC